MNRFLCVALLTVACGSPDSKRGSNDDSARDAVLRSLAADLMTDRYTAFRDNAETFALTAEGCDSDAMKADWWSTREPWKNTEIVWFGPVKEYPERLGPKIDDWPANESAVNELLESTEDLSVDSFASMGSATRGFPAIETILWTAADHPRACAAIQGASGDLAANAGLLLDAWTTRWTPGHSSGKSVLNEWVNQMGFTAQNIRELKLGKPVGDYSNGEPQPDLLESRLSGRSLADARDALEGVRLVWTGVNNQGLRTLIPDESIQQQVDNLLAIAVERLGSIPEPLEEAIVNEPEIVDYAQAPLRELQSVLQRDVATALNVTVTFNDSDGD